MIMIDDILKRTIVIEYYRKNIFLFLGIILLAFGFLRGQEHVTLAKHILSFNSLLIYVLMLWLIYIIKTNLFVLRNLNLTKNRFLFHIALLPSKNRWLAFAKVEFQLLLPVILYAFFMMGVGWSENRYSQIITILLFFIVSIFFSILVLEKRILKHPQKEGIVEPSILKQRSFSLSSFMFFPVFLISKEPILFLLSKIGSFWFIIFTFWLYPTDQYDLRLFALMVIMLTAIHYQIIATFFSFWEGSFSIFRNLPLSYFSMIKMTGVSYLLLILPEILVIGFRGLEYFSLNFLISLILFFISFITILHYIQYLYMVRSEVKYQIYFFGFLTIFILVMFKIPLWVFSVLFLVFSYYIVSKKCQNYEYTTEN